MTAVGAAATHAVAYARRAPSGTLLVLAPRLIATLVSRSVDAPLGDVWGDTTVAPPAECRDRRWRDLFTGRETAPLREPLRMAQALRDFPVAVWWTTD